MSQLSSNTNYNDTQSINNSPLQSSQNNTSSSSSSSNSSRPRPPATADRLYRPVWSALQQLPSTQNRYPPSHVTQDPIVNIENGINPMHGFVWSDLTPRRPRIRNDLSQKLQSHFDHNFANILNVVNHTKSITPITREIAHTHGRWFKQIQEQLPNPQLTPLAARRNRWSNVLPNEFYRIPLATTTTSSSSSSSSSTRADLDYINASDILPVDNIDGLNQTYIACQAPTSDTLGHMWQMIWQQHVELIVNLTKFVEHNDSGGVITTKEKSTPYWPIIPNGTHQSLSSSSTTTTTTNVPTSPDGFTSPIRSTARPSPSHGPYNYSNTISPENRFDNDYNTSNNTAVYGSFEVETQSSHSAGDTTLLTFLLKNLGDPKDPDGSNPHNRRTVKMLHFTGWRDHGLPDPNSMFQLIRAYKSIKSTMVIPQSPPIIHCSAGIGRTGTFIAIDMMLDHMAYLQKQSRQADIRRVADIVSGLRLCRPGMVQTDGQYSFIYWFLQYCAGHPKRHQIGLPNDQHNIQQ